MSPLIRLVILADIPRTCKLAGKRNSGVGGRAHGRRNLVAEVKAELVGNLWKIVTEVGQHVDEDDTIMILESMKMEIPILSPMSGTIKEFLVKEGEVVQEGQTVAIIE
jgi:acetyl-CoA carboxylase biotin carboxyl carrier protein